MRKSHNIRGFITHKTESHITINWWDGDILTVHKTNLIGDWSTVNPQNDWFKAKITNGPPITAELLQKIEKPFDDNPPNDLYNNLKPIVI